MVSVDLIYCWVHLTTPYESMQDLATEDLNLSSKDAMQAEPYRIAKKPKYLDDYVWAKVFCT